MSDDPWDEDPHYAHQAAWQNLSTQFTNSGYRQGIIAGKEASLQEGFDVGFANAGTPIGRELGALRGVASALVSFLSSINTTPAELDEARAIATSLSRIRFTDIAPPDIEAEQHAREHLGNDDPGLVQTEVLSQKREMEILEEMLSHMNARGTEQIRPTREDVVKLKGRLSLLSERLGLSLSLQDLSTDK
ncbi:hypothetical protein EDD16DRAFT_1725270 [Pisolithus croceorrhizus]|nr:hypothetical protein EV401DRAFT_2070256 [Pisolithus croceorrhizus]KAI6123454.1 hypothetical protein EDD16DRAFT_1725270 [Pisolithus croceorrhizus]KAI6149019.1 hypothetical protein EDD17DRAFT_1878936 [Pisolithus thermaeus]